MQAVDQNLHPIGDRRRRCHGDAMRPKAHGNGSGATVCSWAADERKLPLFAPLIAIIGRAGELGGATLDPRHTHTHVVREEGLFLVPHTVDLSKHKMAQYRYLLRGYKAVERKAKTFLLPLIFLCCYWFPCAYISVLRSAHLVEMFLQTPERYLLPTRAAG